MAAEQQGCRNGPFVQKTEAQHRRSLEWGKRALRGRASIFFLRMRQTGLFIGVCAWGVCAQGGCRLGRGLGGLGRFCLWVVLWRLCVFLFADSSLVLWRGLACGLFLGGSACRLFFGGWAGVWY